MVRYQKERLCLVLMLIVCLVSETLCGTIHASAADTDVSEMAGEVIEPTSEGNETSEVVRASEGSETSEVDETSEEIETSEVDETSEGSESSEGTETSEGSETSEEIVASEASETSEESEASEVDEDDYQMPNDYKLTQEQVKAKKELKEHLGEIGACSSDAYVDQEVVFLAASEEEATLIAEGYQAELTSFAYGVGVLSIPNTRSVYQTAVLAASEENNLPAVWPNYVRRLHSDTQMRDDQRFKDPFLDRSTAMFQWHHDIIGSQYAWKEGYTGEGITVAVLDGGFDRLVVNGQEEIAVSDYREIAYCDGDPNTEVKEFNSHGTKVAGLIAARSNDVVGCGVAPDAELINIRIADAFGYSSDEEIMRGINVARESSYGTDIINLSVGGPGYNGDYQRLLDAAYNEGIVVIASAGNENTSSESYPAAYNHVLSIAATNESNQRATFSNFGTTIDLCAPGKGLITADKEDEWTLASGTSFACPIIAGEAAVILSANPTALQGKTGSKKVDALEKLMKSSTISVGTGMGKGIVSLTKALKIKTLADKPNTPVIKVEYIDNNNHAKISIESSENNAIYYCTYDTDIAKNSLGMLRKYEEPFYLSDAKMVKAITVNEAGVRSSVAKKNLDIRPKVRVVLLSGNGTVVKGQSLQIQASFYPNNAYCKKLKWTVIGQPKGITVSSSGKVTVSKSAALGQYRIEARSIRETDKYDTFYLNVTEEVLATDIKFKIPELLITGTSTQAIDLVQYLEITNANPSKPVNRNNLYWTSSDMSIASVIREGGGQLSPYAEGTVTVTVAVRDSLAKKATLKVHIAPRASKVNMRGRNTVARGKTTTIYGYYYGKDLNKELAWEVKPKDQGVTVTNGVVTASKTSTPGTYTVVATDTKNHLYGEYNVRVVEGDITKIQFDSKSYSLFRVPVDNADKCKLSTTINVFGNKGYDASLLNVYTNGPDIIKYRINNESTIPKLEVEPNGMGTGTVQVFISSTDGGRVYTSCKVTVENPVSGVYIGTKDGTSTNIAIGSKVQLMANVTYNYGSVKKKGVTWDVITEDDKKPEGVTISSSGTLTIGKKAIPGSTIFVYAYAKDGSGTYDLLCFQLGYEMAQIKVGNISEVPLIERVNNQNYNLDLPWASGYSVSIPLDIKGPGGVAMITSPSISTSSSNSKVAVAEVMYDDSGAPILNIRMMSKGKTKVTLTTKDGKNKKVSFTFTVKEAFN